MISMDWWTGYWYIYYTNDIDAFKQFYTICYHFRISVFSKTVSFFVKIRTYKWVNEKR